MTTVQVFDKVPKGGLQRPLFSVDVSIDRATQTLLGVVMFGAKGEVMRFSVDLKRIEKTLLAAYLRAQAKMKGQTQVGFLGKALNKVKQGIKNAAKAVGIAKVVGKAGELAKKIAKGAKKVINSPAFAAAVGITGQALSAAGVPGAEGLQAGYNIARQASAIADGVLRRDPAALAEVAKLAGLGPQGQQVLDMVSTFRASPAPVVPLSANPWRVSFVA